MATTTAPERAFLLFPRGKIRDEIMLPVLRNGLRRLYDPETGQLFTEEQVRVATQFGSRPWIRAESIDILGLGWQARASFLADQVRPDHANTRFLREVWMPEWDLAPLPAVGGKGEALATGAPGSLIVGSPLIPDPTAHTARDAAGIVYQVLETVVVGASGTAFVKFRAIVGGYETNLEPGSALTWSNSPAGVEPDLTIEAPFVGGYPAESDSEGIARLIARIRYKPAAGNWSHMRTWAREASAAVEDGFVYPTAMRAGSTLVCVTQKRGRTLGPLARIPNPTTMGDVIAYLVPPNSPVVPGRPYIVCVPPQSQPTDAVLRLSMRRASAGGWANAAPWPGKFAIGGAAAAVQVVTDPTHFVMHSDTFLPGGSTTLAAPQAPRIMRWDYATSKFEELAVASITYGGFGLFTVVLTVAPSSPLLVGDLISPFSARHDALEQAIEAYFDGLGPGEVIDLELDERGDRAFRNPEPTRERAARAGQGIIAQIGELLQSDVSAGEVFSLSDPNPALPSSPIAGPFLVTVRQVGVYDFT